ncbi:alpha/beta fold hydrolase [Nocardioides sp. LHD-245]|uniref:alpha/beta fold hydrolase n=1 Tax=Nocardioides sp. LHD-245 TaxID=3051387 RepID=UPI0027E0579C|nr:alpha/beta fold hydrolase [Nocardioides sp. LHD-245]
MSDARPRLAVEWRGEGTAAAPPLVVLHGGGPGCHAAADFRALLPFLADRKLLLVDLPGYGGSPLPTVRGPRMAGCADTLAALLDDRDLTGCDVVTTSLGGIVAMVLSARRPDLVGRLVACGSQPLPAPPGVVADLGLGPRARAAYYEAGEPSPERLRATVLALEWHDPSRIPDALVRMRYAASVSPASRAVAADPGLLGEPDDLTGLLDEVGAETLVLWGEHDPFGEPAYGAWLADGLPRGSAAVIPGAAHHPQAEFPERTADLVRAHLS